MKRHTRRQWYQYHQQKAVYAATAAVVSRFTDSIAEAEQGVRSAEDRLDSALTLEPRLSAFLSFFGVQTAYRSANIQPLQIGLGERRAWLDEILERQRVDLLTATHKGVADYREAHAQRKEELLARQERAVERAHEKRIRYLERSPRIRSAARFLKSILIKQNSSDGDYVTCFYCGVEIRAADSHLEHKKPISRGGDNRRGNLVLACPSCNLAKGKKTDEEFIRARNKRDL